MSMLNLQLPQYETVLPISGLKVTYRPFVVKEQKILILALEEDNIPAIIQAIRQIIGACTFDKVSADFLTRVDTEYLFVKIRNASMGEGVEVYGKCERCSEQSETTLDFTKVKVLNADKGTQTIELSDNLWVEMEAPSLTIAYEAIQTDVSAEYVAAMAIKTIIQGDNSINTSEYSIEDRIDFIDNLTYKQSALLNDFFKGLPSMVLEHPFHCPKCGKDSIIKLEGLEDFFI